MTLHKIGRNLAPAVVLSVAKDLIAACYGHEILRCAQDDGKERYGSTFHPRSVHRVLDAAVDGAEDPQALPFDHDRTADRRGELNFAGLGRIGG